MEAERTYDLELLYIAAVSVAILGVVVYSVLFQFGRLPYWYLHILFFAVVVLVVATNWKRYFIYEVSRKRITMRYGFLLPSRKEELLRSSVEEMYLVDRRRFRRLGGRDDALDMYFLLKKGKGYLRVKDPPKRLSGMLEDKWKMEPVRSTRTRFFQDLHLARYR